MDATLPEIRWLETRMSRWDDLVAAAAESGVRVTPETAMRTAAYMACARVVAETVACLPLHVYRKRDDYTSERAKDLPIYHVLAKRPNRYQTRYQWVEQIVEAALERSRDKFIQALILDGATSSVDQAVALADDLLAVQAAHLPGWEIGVRHGAAV